MNKTITFVIPTMNCETFISKMFDSLVEQTSRNYSIVVCDGFSKDGTISIIQKYKKIFNELGVELLLLEKPGNICRAINEMLPHINTDYFITCDSDDWYDPNTVENITKYILDKGKIDIGFIGCKYWDDNNNFLYLSEYNEDKDIDYLYRYITEIGKIVCFPGINVYNTLSFKQANPMLTIFESKYGQNWQLLIPMLKMYYPAIIPGAYYNYRIRNGSLAHRGEGFEKWYQVEVNRCLILEQVLIINNLYNVYGKIALNRRRKKILYKCYQNRDYSLFKETFIKLDKEFINIKLKCMRIALRIHSLFHKF